MGLFSRRIPDDKMAEVKRLLAKAQDEAQAANTSSSPSAFFAHYDAFMESLKALRPYERYPMFRGGGPSRDLRRAQDNKQNEINSMIQRSYVSVRDRAARKSTVAERQVLFDTLFKSLDEYQKRMNRFNRKVVADLKAISARQVEDMPFPPALADPDASEVDGLS